MLHSAIVHDCGDSCQLVFLLAVARDVEHLWARFQHLKELVLGSHRALEHMRFARLLQFALDRLYLLQEVKLAPCHELCLLRLLVEVLLYDRRGKEESNMDLVSELAHILLDFLHFDIDPLILVYKLLLRCRNVHRPNSLALPPYDSRPHHPKRLLRANM